MRRIERDRQFRRDFKRELKSRHSKTLKLTLSVIIQLLIYDHPLPEKHRDHALTGNWKSFRNCHIKPDLILIYRRPDDEVLQLVRLGSHSELGL
jgi:mRNA interferase YafQ